VTLPVTIAVLAKAPVPGRVKTRLCPPCTPAQAASVARAALQDTLDTARRVDARRHVLVLDGDPAAWEDRGFDVLPQRGDGLDERLAAAFRDISGRTLLIGMDTPQLRAADLATAARSLATGGAAAVLGLAEDGGFWAVGLPAPDDGAFRGVPMSRPHTGAAQLQRLAALGYEVRHLPRWRDVDEWGDALAVAELAPTSGFARAVATVESELVDAGAA
jgi:hypothetical protein